MLWSLPLTLVSLVAYNAVVLLGGTGDPSVRLAAPLFAARLPSGATLAFDTGSALIVLSVALLFVEILKATRTGNASLADHMLSVAVLIAFIVEFLTVGIAGHPVFVVLTVLSLTDVIAGFSVTIRGARRDVDWN
jgi:hypothetical protein